MKIDRNKIYGITTKEILEKNLDYKKFLTNEKSDFEDILYYEEIQDMFPNQHLVVEVINPGYFGSNDGYRVLYYRCDKKFAEMKSIELDKKYCEKLGYGKAPWVDILSCFDGALSPNQVLIGL